MTKPTAKTKPNSKTVITQHVVDTLPDSINARIALLESLLSINPPGSPLRDHICELLIDLKNHELKQLSFRNLKV